MIVWHLWSATREGGERDMEVSGLRHPRGTCPWHLRGTPLAGALAPVAPARGTGARTRGIKIDFGFSLIPRAAVRTYVRPRPSARPPRRPPVLALDSPSRLRALADYLERGAKL
jgi:hypothetical protein